MRPELKASNPKEAVGSGKLPLELVPDIVSVAASLAFLEGALKYGRYNWRASGVRASTYRSAMQRHMIKWWNGEDCDPHTGVPHLASVIACCGIILDATVYDNVVDDRPPSQPQLGQIVDESLEDIAHLKELFKDCAPHQWTIKDEINHGSQA